jgi:hypothetical protein
MFLLAPMSVLLKNTTAFVTGKIIREHIFYESIRGMKSPRSIDELMVLILNVSRVLISNFIICCSQRIRQSVALKLGSRLQEDRANPKPVEFVNTSDEIGNENWRHLKLKPPVRQYSLNSWCPVCFRKICARRLSSQLQTQ